MAMLWLIIAGIDLFMVVMFVIGIIALIRAKFALTGGLATEGLPARLVGLLWLFPYPISMCLRLLAGMFKAPPQRPAPVPGMQGVQQVLAFQNEMLTYQNTMGVIAFFIHVAVLATFVVATFAVVYLYPASKVSELDKLPPLPEPGEQDIPKLQL